MMGKYDIIIIGGGPNGLVAGAYLAKAGQKVLVLERRFEMGGGLATEEVIGTPRFYANTHAIYMMMVDYAPAYQDLELEELYGLKHVYPSLQFAMPLQNKRSLCLYTDVERSCDSIAQFSQEDANTYKEIHAEYRRYMDEFLAPATYVQPLPVVEQAAKLEANELGREISEMSERTPQEIVYDLFKNNHVRGLMLQIACLWGLDPEQAGLGYLVPLFMNRATNYRICVGGSHMLAQALIRVILCNGGELRTAARIKRIMLDNGIATGVDLEDGRIYEAAKAIISTIDTHQTFLGLLGEEKLEGDFADSLKQWRWEDWSFLGIHLALDEAPEFAAAKDKLEVNNALVYLLGCETGEDFVSHYRRVKEGGIGGTVGLKVSFPSLHDPSQAPPGKHTGHITQMAPYNLKEGKDKWYSLRFRQDQFDRALGLLARYAPNMTGDKVRNYYVSTPVDIENKLPDMVQGSFKQGLYHPFQMGFMRPNEYCSEHRSPIKRLYLGGSCTFPGGTVLLGPGYLAADAVCEDLGIPKWWAEPEMVSKARAKGLL